MIIDRYDPVNLFEMIPKLKLEMEPELAGLDELLDDDELFSLVKADLMKRYPNSGRLGRHSTPVEVILRMLVVKRLYGFSYEQTEHFVSDSIVRSSCGSSAACTSNLCSRRHHSDPVGQPDRSRDGRITQRSSSRVGPFS
jgi:hypothetical protein